MGRPTATGKSGHYGRTAGFTLLGLLFLVAGLGIGMAAVGTLWHTAAIRERELELLFVGNQYRQAIRSFWETPLPAGVPRRLPRNFDELLSDPRFAQTVRHLRRIYRDPVTGGREWGLVREPDGGISGVYCLSREKPMKQTGFDRANHAFEGRERYSEWIFFFNPLPPASGISPAVANRNDLGRMK